MSFIIDKRRSNKRDRKRKKERDVYENSKTLMDRKEILILQLDKLKKERKKDCLSWRVKPRERKKRG